MPIGVPTLVGTIDGSTSGSPPETITLVFPSMIPVGTMILIAANGITTSVITGVTDSRGNTYTVNAELKKASSNVSGHIASGFVTTQIEAADVLTLTWSTFDFVFAKVFSVTGMVSSPFDVAASAEQDFATAYSSGNTANTAQNDELLFGLNATDDETASFVSTGSFTELTDNAGTSTSCRLQTQYRIVAATAAYASTATLSTNGDGVALIATYKGDTGPPPIYAVAWIRA